MYIYIPFIDYSRYIFLELPHAPLSSHLTSAFTSAASLIGKKRAVGATVNIKFDFNLVKIWRRFSKENLDKFIF